MVSFYDDTFSVENPDLMLTNNNYHNASSNLNNTSSNFARDMNFDLPAELIQSLTEDAAFGIPPSCTSAVPFLTVTPSALEPLLLFSSPASSPLSPFSSSSAFMSAPSSPADPSSSSSSSSSLGLHLHQQHQQQLLLEQQQQQQQSSSYLSPYAPPLSPSYYSSSPSSSAGSSPSSSPPASPFLSAPYSPSSSPFMSSPFLSTPLSPASSPLLRVPTSFRYTSPPSPSCVLDGGVVPSDCSECTILPSKRVLFRPRDSNEGQEMPLTEFYKRIQSTAVTQASLVSQHPHFATHDDAVGVFYILKNATARKPPQIGGRAFNCHTRRDAGAAHWQYNVPGTDFTCRVSQWSTNESSTGEEVVYTSYHYYRSPVARRSKMAYSPY